MCQIRVFVSSVAMAFVGYLVGKLLGQHVLLPFVIGGTLVGWLAGNISNKTIFASKACDIQPYHDR